ncbi:YdeI/OmpD-associated family protein [Flavobacterium sp. 83]|uniref:YdeI/OmpD-associated family protein n=1 Tax=Flavobacterium sp. 83 TaxID=1131812 RepID=UPI0009DD8D76|nr:YdeI/OmpD-associated family protein [Flavobacterium sp. 83]
MNPKVDDFIGNATKWQTEIIQLRTLLLDCGLTEEFKWRMPCYCFERNNIVLMGSFKEYCTLSFFKGILLQDSRGLLSKPGENSQSMRFFKFINLEEIIEQQSIIKAYIYEAIEIEKAGLKVIFKSNTELELVEELQIALDKNPALKTAFNTLTPGRQRAYNLYFSEAKQSKTRETRIEKYTQRILNGKGINDCTCGLSKKLPNCDGSHKYIRAENK